MACCNAGHLQLWVWQQPQRRYDLWCWKKVNLLPNDTSLPSPGHLLVPVLQLCFVSSSPGCPTHQRQKGQSRAPDTYGTWHYIGILSEFIPAKGDATTGSGNRIDIISNIEQEFHTKSGFICGQILNLTWPVPKPFQEETRETSNNPHFYQVWSGLIWNNTCKIDLKTRSVTDPIVGVLRPRLEKHAQMEYLVSQAQTLKMVGIGQIIGRLKTCNCKVIFIWGYFSSWVSTGHALLQGSPLPPALSSSHCLQTSGRSF